MIEVLVTLIILMVGLLGVAGLMVQGQRSEMESYQRVQALILLHDMAARIEANRQVSTYQTAVSSVGTGASPTCPGATVAQTDICQWHNALLGSAETSGASGVGAMIGARGCVSYDSTNEASNGTGAPITISLDGASSVVVAGANVPNTGIYTVAVAWQGLGNSFAPTNIHNTPALDCGKNQFSDERQRRIISMTTQFGCLGC